MEPSEKHEDKPLWDTMQEAQDNLARLERRVTMVEKQAEALFTIVEAVLLFAGLYLAWPYLEEAVKRYSAKIPGVAE